MEDSPFSLEYVIIVRMDWSQKRKILYALGFAIIIILLVSYPAYKVFYKTPTCFDKKQNGTETGVDCGGGCALVCAVDVKAPRVVWAKVFPINSSYDIGVFVENVNINAGIRSADYAIRVFDDAENVLSEKKGATEIAPASTLLLFETGATFSGIPARVEVSFDSEDLNNWEKATTAPSPVVTKNQSLKNVDTKPRFDAVLVNTDPVNEVDKLSLGAIVYDSLRHPVAVSKTYVDRISKGGEHNIFFTWPSALENSTDGYLTEIIVTPRAIFTK